MFFERPASGEVTILVHITLETEYEREDPAEFEELALSAGAAPAVFITGSRAQPSPSHFVGSGKLEEIQAAIHAYKAELVLFNHALSPSQERNLESELKCRVLDRTGLILDIFAQRARSHEGKLQVELAQLQHLSSRLKRGWTHLDRQKGGIGMRGAGEKQLELDQRMIGQRIKAINKGLKKVRGQRDQGRRSRQRAEIATISLVGYTNAGKSSLFNRLTNAETFIADQLFATLDSTLRKIKLRNYGPAIVADTVGFISHLPHQLVEAFRATLEETAQADLLLHVVDAAHEMHPEFISEVDKVLVEIGAKSVEQLLVFNKIDLIANCEPRIQRDKNGRPEKVWVSAKTGAGLDLLQEAMSELLAGSMAQETLRVSPQCGKLRSQLYEKGFIENEHIDEQGFYELQVKLPQQYLDRIVQQEGAEILNNKHAVAEKSTAL
ncbi:MAG: GTPase HflX [SAR86 cluster bacterium]|uniref:GTPase HflX n=1 Tax=SAR86 cluster bacterium TaxID=2030880 RepID=A0A2A5AZY4_9GAMM|nr:MAG: GTPase HflX [SAR86 cluster bacterium]